MYTLYSTLAVKELHFHSTDVLVTVAFRHQNGLASGKEYLYRGGKAESVSSINTTNYRVRLSVYQWVCFGYNGVIYMCLTSVAPREGCFLRPALGTWS